MAKKLKIYNGSSWEDVTFAITPPATNVTNSFTTNQVIEASTSAAALRITQTGSGEALRVEDSSNPDSTPFVIDSAGRVGIGASSPTNLFTVIGSLSGEVVGAFANNNTGINTIALRSGATGGNWANSIALQNYAGSTTYAEIRASVDNQMGLFTNGTERIRIAADGQVNLPNNKLIINSTLSVTGANWAESMLHITGDSTAANNPSVAWHAPGASAMSMWHPRGSQALQIMGNAGVVSTGSGTMTIRNIAISTSTPSGGADGDMWAVYV